MYVYKSIISYEKHLVSEVQNISNPKEISEVFKSILGPVERFGALYLDGRNNITERLIFTELFIGTVDQCQVHIREVLWHALQFGAVRFIVCHNHSSCHLDASSADINLTNRIKEAAKLLDLTLLDHIIVSETGYWSFQENGLL